LLKNEFIVILLISFYFGNYVKVFIGTNAKDIKMTNPGLSELDELCINTIRCLSADAVQKANSGHPGMPIGMAPAAYVLWKKYLRFNPANPAWPNRDRFVLSAGHGCMLLYSLLYLTGFNITLDDIKNFRQISSKTPGHPEYEPDLGIEVTTGPLGQGISNAVGMAIAQKYLASYFNKDKFNIFDYNTYVIAGDGCLQEGVSSEASSLAGHLGLDNLIIIYDDNHITIDGDTTLSFTEDVVKRYESYGWYVQQVSGDGNDMAVFENALQNAINEKERPSIIKLRTHIAYGCPNKQDTAAAHGAPLGEDEIRLLKKGFGWDPDKTFYVPDEVKTHMRESLKKGNDLQNDWEKLFQQYSKDYPDLAKLFNDAIDGKLNIDIEKLLPEFEPGSSVATRKASGAFLNATMPSLPFFIGGSADLTPSNNTRFNGAQDFQKNKSSGRYIHYGVREHAMAAIMNGISVSNILRPYGGTFLVFSDYMRPAIRIAALSGYPTIFIFTHDSIGLGEDGPTHQPIEHLPSLRTIPDLLVFRPADANETIAAWKFIMQYKDGPVALLLTRQSIPVFKQTQDNIFENLSKGAFVIVPAEKPDILFLATGSEVHIAIDAANQLAAEGISAQVVSMPCWELFEKQERKYKDSVIPPDVKKRIGIEAAVELGWRKWLGEKGIFIGMSTFGDSGPAKDCFIKFGITTENVIKSAKNLIKS